MYRLNRNGQFVPMTSMIVMTAVLLMIAGMNVYRISKAKIQTQNMADAAALAVASMEAKAVNTVEDRNEWLNHMYGTSYRFKDGVSVPNLSRKDKRLNNATAQAYANLVASINQAQQMFIAAYNNFLGANDQNQTASNGAGAAALQDILSEIPDLFQNPDILYIRVFNTGDGTSDQDISNALNSGTRFSTDGMKSLQFKTERVQIRDTTNKKNTTLGELLKKDPDEVGWMYPVWNQNTLNVQTSQGGQTVPHWGAGVTIVKQVRLFLFPPRNVRVTSMAYVVNLAGKDVGPGGSLDHPELPPYFQPTYYAQLAYHP